MQNGKDCLNHYNEFVHKLDFEKLFGKIVYDSLALGIINNNVHLYLIDLNKILSLVLVFVQYKTLSTSVFDFLIQNIEFSFLNSIDL